MISEQMVQKLVEPNNTKEIPSITEIQDWLVVHMAEMVDISPDEVDVTMLFAEYGLDSAMTVGMIGELEIWLGCSLDPTLVYDYSSTELLSQHIGSVLAANN